MIPLFILVSSAFLSILFPAKTYAVDSWYYHDTAGGRVITNLSQDSTSNIAWATGYIWWDNHRTDVYKFDPTTGYWREIKTFWRMFDPWVYFLNENVGWVVGKTIIWDVPGGTVIEVIMKTEDGGITWNKVDSYEGATKPTPVGRLGTLYLNITPGSYSEAYVWVSNLWATMCETFIKYGDAPPPQVSSIIPNNAKKCSNAYTTVYGYNFNPITVTISDGKNIKSKTGKMVVVK